MLANFSHDFWGILATGLTAGGAIWLLQCWISLLNRWHELTTVHVYRRQEIEAELGMLDSRYIDWLDWRDHPSRESYCPYFPPTEKELPLFENARRGLVERARAGKNARRKVCRIMAPRSGHDSRVRMAQIAQIAWAFTLLVQGLRYYFDP